MRSYILFRTKYFVGIFISSLFIVAFPVFAEIHVGPVYITELGGSCPLVGIWNDATKTCTLTKDIQGPIYTASDDIVIDGNDHLIFRNNTSPANETIGIIITGSRVIVKNLIIDGFQNGIVLQSIGTGNIVENSTINNAANGAMDVLSPSSGHTFRENSIKNSYWGIHTETSGNTIEDNIFENNSYGVWLSGSLNSVKNNIFINGQSGLKIENGGGNIIMDNIFENNQTHAIHNGSSLVNTILHNNFINNGNLQTNLFSYNISEPLPVGGNYWSDFDEVVEGCIDLNFNNICDQPRYFNGNNVYGDLLPWTKKDGWKETPLPSEYFSIISNISGKGKIYGSEDINNQIKTLPNDWIIKVFTNINSAGWVKIEDPTDGSFGYIQGDINQFPFLAEKQQEYLQKSSTILSTKLERGNVIKEAIHHYFTNSNTAPSLYSGEDNVNFSIFEQIGFSEQLALAIAAQETGGTYNFDNELVSYDYGHGAMQITFHAHINEPIKFQDNKWDNRGRFTKIRNVICRNIIEDQNGNRVDGSNEYKKCYKNTSTQNTFIKPYDNFEHDLSNPKYKQYTNTIQSIYANIKDGLGNLQVDKYRAKCPRQSITINSEVFTCHDIEKIMMIWGYNGITFREDIQYLKNVSDKLVSLSADFPGVSYANTDHFVEKLRIANDNRRTIRVYSPVELSVTDSESRITGLQSGNIKEEIPNTQYFYNEETVVMLFPEDGESYKIVGTDSGTYGVSIESIKNSEVITFEGKDLPISEGEIHSYTFDHGALVQGLNGVVLKIDTEGDGIIDRTIHTKNILSDINPPELIVDNILESYILGSVITPNITINDESLPVTTTLYLNGINVVSPIILTKPGANILKITASDNMGNETTKTFPLEVKYNFSGFKEPIQNDGSGIYKLKSILPLKFSLSDSIGSNVSSSIATLSVKKITNTILGDEIYPINNTGADQGNVFRYDTLNKQYIYNFSTKTLTKGTWQLNVILDDNTTHSVQVSLN